MYKEAEIIPLIPSDEINTFPTFTIHDGDEALLNHHFNQHRRRQGFDLRRFLEAIDDEYGPFDISLRTDLGGHYLVNERSLPVPEKVNLSIPIRSKEGDLDLHVGVELNWLTYFCAGPLDHNETYERLAAVIDANETTGEQSFVRAASDNLYIASTSAPLHDSIADVLKGYAGMALSNPSNIVQAEDRASSRFFPSQEVLDYRWERRDPRDLFSSPSDPSFCLDHVLETTTIPLLMMPDKHHWDIALKYDAVR